MTRGDVPLPCKTGLIAIIDPSDSTTHTGAITMNERQTREQRSKEIQSALEDEGTPSIIKILLSHDLRRCEPQKTDALRSP